MPRKAAEKEECSFPGCTRPQRYRTTGLCDGHYAQRWRGEELRPIRLTRKQRGCKFEGCDMPHSRYGYCDGHSRQLAKGYELRPLGWRKTGRTKDAAGYVRVRMPEHSNANGLGYVLEHRLVMSEMLGRPLRDDETVHHKNGRRDDNRPENLELWSTKHSNGQRVEDLVEFAKDILRIYEKG